MTYLVETSRWSSGKVVIGDLKKTVSPASPCWVSAEELRFSICLQNLQKKGVVTVTQKSRSKVVKSKKPERVKARLSRKGSGKKMMKPHAAEESGLSKQDLEELLAKTARQAALQAAAAVARSLPAQPPAANLEGLEKRLTDLVAGLVQTQTQTPGPDLEGLEKRLTDLVGGLVRQARAPGTPPPVSGPEEPMFIPQGIVDSADNAQLDVQTSSLTDEDLSGIAEALKNLRKNK